MSELSSMIGILLFGEAPSHHEPSEKRGLLRGR